ncbi:hypothetical protein A9X03_09695 [Mycobacterium sp. E1715]|nr:hypothetical protein A5704_15715 [Mycobacterium sp. E735]OBG65522.1 hypothetical protein A5703_15570 [Mycobacterium sp. E188]OBG74263.1 hypothetical protein A5701_22050 [Mycobacterium sp. E3305]OBG78912.1 hypothetical protein A9X05_22630 [Mycobacterium sp. E3298]OBH29235.1 hypothetical protein A9X03_09695 [Mycobacterium sp. E1715]OBH43712.1 hypothetical protein A5691_16950 [Mycobacterium sp. E183]
MLVKQRVASVDQWNDVFREPRLDATRRRHGLVVTGTYIDGDDPTTVIVVMKMENIDAARRFAASSELARAREHAGAIGPPDGVWLGARPVDD